MIMPYYKVDCLNGVWCIVIAKGKKAGTIISAFGSSEAAWKALANLQNSDVKL